MFQKGSCILYLYMSNINSFPSPVRINVLYLEFWHEFLFPRNCSTFVPLFWGTEYCWLSVLSFPYHLCFHLENPFLLFYFLISFSFLKFTSFIKLYQGSCFVVVVVIQHSWGPLLWRPKSFHFSDFFLYHILTYILPYSMDRWRYMTVRITTWNRNSIRAVRYKCICWMSFRFGCELSDWQRNY